MIKEILTLIGFLIIVSVPYLSNDSVTVLEMISIQAGFTAAGLVIYYLDW